jgi:tRNA(Arg) A34 adenosine deaminase TadA
MPNKPTKDDCTFMRAAINKALEGVKKGQTPFGACIVKNGKIVVTAHNVVWNTTDITAHAEVTALRAACKKLKTIDLSGCTIYSTCEPCPMCFAACHWANVDEIVYGTRIADAKKCGFNELHISNTLMKNTGRRRVKIRGNVLRAESQKVFDTWLAKKDKKTY